MKRIRVIELFANIRANLVAFLSIAMFVCLGVGLFLGIMWGAVALRNAVDEVFDKSSLADMEIQFPYGITDDDLARLREVEGVSQVETGYSAFVAVEDGSTSHIFKMQTAGTSMNLPTAVKGNMPVEGNEVAVLEVWATDHGLTVGDTLTLSHDATSDEDADGMEYLTSDTFTITALVHNPPNISRGPGSIGVSNIGAGTLDCVGYVTNAAFDTDKYQGGYPNVYIRCDSLRGLSTFDDEYRQTIAPITEAVTELGGELGSARYQKILGEAQNKIDEAQQRIDEGEQALAEGQQQISEGEQALTEGQQQISEGEQQLAEGQQTLSAEQVEGTNKLAEAYRQLSESQAQYDAGLAEYNTARELYDQVNGQFSAVRGDYDRLVSLYDALRADQSGLSQARDTYQGAVSAYEDAASDEREMTWGAVQQSYDELAGVTSDLGEKYGQLASVASSVGNAINLPIELGSLGSLAGLSEGGLGQVATDAQAIDGQLTQSLDSIANASVTVGNVTVYLLDIPGGLTLISDELVSNKAKLDEAKVQLDAGWAEYNAAKQTYDSEVAQGKDKISEGQKQLEEGKAELEQKSAELEEGKAQLEAGKAELEAGKAELEAGKAEFDKLVEYEWVIMPRQDFGGVQKVSMVSRMMDSVKWAMASLFIVVGLFVCYSAISRLVHEQIVQIGTKKAVGFRESEIASGYLAFSGLAVFLGLVASIAMGVFVVQAIMNPTVIRQYTIPAYGPHVDLRDVAVLGCVEMLLILASTWLAIHGLLRRDARSLLQGESTSNVREHFYERTRLWQRMSLYSQTIVNNCVNDKRRVAGTLVGVVGCTALIVVAVTLASNVSRSIEHHYDEVYGFDSIVHLDGEGNDKAKGVAMRLYDYGIASTPAFMRQLQVRQSDGTRSIATLVVPTNEDSFQKFYDVVSTSGGEADVEAGGLWVCAAYAEHMGVGVGDEVVLTENTGKTHTFTIAGFFDYYLLREEFVLSQMTYREAFGTKPEANVLLVNRDDANIDRLRDALKGVEGYVSMVDDYADVSYTYVELQSILRSVVLVYLLLSALMAVMVLLNLDVMFVDEKKRELIVLMINGFSTRQAKAYIYRDSIVLTVLGILLGIVLGAVMGAWTVFALEPEMGYFVKDFNEVAAFAGAVGAGGFATAVLFWALRRIPRFRLTDVNRY